MVGICWQVLACFTQGKTLQLGAGAILDMRPLKVHGQEEHFSCLLAKLRKRLFQG